MLEILSRHWDWAIQSPVGIVAQNAFGNLLVELADGSIWRVCPEDLAATRIACSAGELPAVMADDEFNLDWVAANWVDAAAVKLGPLGPGQCYGFRIWPPLGAEYSVNNMATKALAEWLAVSGDVGRQVKDYPDGTQVRLVTEDD